MVPKGSRINVHSGRRAPERDMYMDIAQAAEKVGRYAKHIKDSHATGAAFGSAVGYFGAGRAADQSNREYRRMVRQHVKKKEVAKEKKMPKGVERVTSRSQLKQWTKQNVKSRVPFMSGFKQRSQYRQLKGLLPSERKGFVGKVSNFLTYNPKTAKYVAPTHRGGKGAVVGSTHLPGQVIARARGMAKDMGGRTQADIRRETPKMGKIERLFTPATDDPRYRRDERAWKNSGVSKNDPFRQASLEARKRQTNIDRAEVIGALVGGAAGVGHGAYKAHKKGPRAIPMPHGHNSGKEYIDVKFTKEDREDLIQAIMEATFSVFQGKAGQGERELVIDKNGTNRYWRVSQAGRPTRFIPTQARGSAKPVTVPIDTGGSTVWRRKMEASIADASKNIAAKKAALKGRL